MQAQIRLLLWEQTDLGLHCFSVFVPMLRVFMVIMERYTLVCSVSVHGKPPVGFLRLSTAAWLQKKDVVL